ncbi:HIT-like protein [Suillus decipiens]|nr:HIT-like protein [Suillus decipiens]
MTSFIIGAPTNRSIPTEWRDDADRNCPFCRIITGEMPSTHLYEDDKVSYSRQVLDILPLRRGHTLVIPKTHYSRVSELPSEYAGAVGQAVTKVANGLTKGEDAVMIFNGILCNQEYAQAVPHVHYHIIPAPSFDSSTGVEPSEKAKENEIPLSRREMHQREFESREELDDDEGRVLTVRVRASL